MRWCLALLLVFIGGATAWASNATSGCERATTCRECYGLYLEGESCGFLTTKNGSDIFSGCVLGNETGPMVNESFFDSLSNSTGDYSFEFGFCCDHATTCRNCTNKAPTCGFRFNEQTCHPLVYPDTSPTCLHIGDTNGAKFGCYYAYRDPYIRTVVTDGETIYGHVTIDDLCVSILRIGDQGPDRAHVLSYVSLTETYPNFNNSNFYSDDGANITLYYYREPRLQATPDIHYSATCLRPTCSLEIRIFCDTLAGDDGGYWYIIFIVGIFVIAGLLVGYLERRQRVRRRLDEQLLNAIRAGDGRVDPSGELRMTLIPPEKRRNPVHLDVFLEGSPTLMIPILGPQSLEILLDRPDDRPKLALEAVPRSIPTAGIPSSQPGTPSIATPPSLDATPETSLPSPEVPQTVQRVGSVDSLLSTQSAGTEARVNIMMHLEQLWVGVKILNEHGPPYMISPDLSVDADGWLDAENGSGDEGGEQVRRQVPAFNHHPEPSALPGGAGADPVSRV